jgi:hypothetical protein
MCLQQVVGVRADALRYAGQYDRIFHIQQTFCELYLRIRKLWKYFGRQGMQVFTEFSLNVRRMFTEEKHRAGQRPEETGPRPRP